PMSNGLLRLFADKLTFRTPDYVEYGEGSTVTLPVWRLVDPGGGTSTFFRAIPEGAANCPDPITTDVGPDIGFDHDAVRPGAVYGPGGKLWQQRDEFGHVWTFEYCRMPVNPGTVGRVAKIYLGGVDQND